MKHSYKVAICAPVHIQVSDEWIQAVDSLGVDVIIVDDSDGKVRLPAHWNVYDYKRQKEILGDKYEYWQKFQHSSASKNIGHYVAYCLGYDIIMGIDSDCIPGADFVSQHIENLESVSYGWENPLHGTGWYSRGFPFSKRKLKTAFSLGLWSNELDLYGTDRVHHPELDPKLLPEAQQKVAQTYIPLSGMNWATWRENIPDLLFLPNHNQRVPDVSNQSPYILEKYRRHDDIWGGYIFQKKMLARNERLVYGLPIVYHDTVVVPEEDAEEEIGMIRDEDDYFAWVDAGMPLVHNSIKWDWVLESLAFWKSLYA